MPSALYAISYRPTCSVVALCSFEKQDLVGPAAWDQLLAALVGAALPLSMSTSGATIEIVASDLGCDLVKQPSRQDFEAALAEPYRYRVSLDPETPTLPILGDGKEKVLRKANRNAVKSIALIDGVSAQVKVTLASPPPDGFIARLIFEGRDPATASRETSTSRDLLFTLPSDVTITASASYGVLFLLDGAPVEARSVKAPPATLNAASGPTAPIVQPPVLPKAGQ